MPQAADSRRAKSPIAIHLLDVGPTEYGDAILCQFGDQTILIDGAHPGDYEKKSPDHVPLQDQLGDLLETSPPYTVSLLIVTHAHQDHIGCLPYLVRNNLLKAEWALVADPAFGWGRRLDRDVPEAALSPDARQIVAALREEPPSNVRLNDARALRDFLADAAVLEQTYRQMLEKLKTDGTRLFRWGEDNAQDLLDEFKRVGLKIYGPTRPHLEICADRINNEITDATTFMDAAFAQDAALGPVEIYRRALGAVSTSPTGVAADSGARPGAAVNNQSLVLGFRYGGKRFLLTGDMQLAHAEVTGLDEEMEKLRVAIGRDAPFDLVKLPHHGSYNAVDEDMLTRLGNPTLIGITTGVNSDKHPSLGVLNELARRADSIQWARTDRNGLVTFSFEGEVPKIATSRGDLNDANPPTADPGPPLAPPVPRASEVVTTGVSQGSLVSPRPQPTTGPAIDVVEVITRVPHLSTRVTVTIDVEPRPGPSTPDRIGDRLPEVRSDLRLAGGRALPPLLFVTRRDGLRANIGEAETERVLGLITAAGQAVFADLPIGLPSAVDAFGPVQAALRQRPDVQGVVVLGGYDVVPSLRLDVISDALRQRIAGSHPDADDNFFVWSDDRYGDRDGDKMPEVPVSRIPDGRSANFLLTALTASAKTVSSRKRGVRNVKRPFADRVYAALPGDGVLLQSVPTKTGQVPAIDLAADRVYLMLHGHFYDGTRFWGEGTADGPEAVSLGNIPSEAGATVFCGCCWGALPVDQPAWKVGPGQSVSPRTAASSIALAFLAAGALAFVGCTGTHYSPPPDGGPFLASQPMHEVFWRRSGEGAAPAEALFDAKRAFLATIPEGSGLELRQAIALKTYHQFTCLGLGW